MARIFTEEEHQYLANNYKTKFNYELAIFLKRTIGSISRYLQLKGFKRTKEEYLALSQRRKPRILKVKSAPVKRRKYKKRALKRPLFEKTKDRRKEERIFFEKKEEQFLSTYKKKTLDEATTQEIDGGKIPIRIDHKTVVFLPKNKCIQLEDGTWIKKK